MKTSTFRWLMTGLVLLGITLPSWADEEPAAKEPPKKEAPKVPDKGKFEIEVTSGERAKTFDHPSQALSEIARAVARAKRAKDGETPLFEAVMTLNEQVFKFSDPEAAQEACKAVTTALRELPKLRMGLGDLGEIPDVNPEDANPTGRTKAQAVAEVRRRIQVALRQQLSGGTRSGRPTMPTPQTMQRIVAQEVDKARQEGLLPPDSNAGGFGGGDPREAKKEAIVQTLALAFSKADSADSAGEQPTEEKPEN